MIIDRCLSQECFLKELEKLNNTENWKGREIKYGEHKITSKNMILFLENNRDWFSTSEKNLNLLEANFAKEFNEEKAWEIRKRFFCNTEIPISKDMLVLIFSFFLQYSNGRYSDFSNFCNVSRVSKQ